MSGALTLSPKAKSLIGKRALGVITTAFPGKQAPEPELDEPLVLSVDPAHMNELALG